MDAKDVFSLGEKTTFNKKAVYGTVPKALIQKYLFQMKGTTAKVLLAIIEGTDCYYRIAFRLRKRSKNISDTAGVHENSVRKALVELEKLGIIGGYVPGKGDAPNEFYLTFDIDHYKEQQCLEVEEIEDYFRHLSLRRVDGFFVPDPETVTPSPENNDSSHEISDTSINTRSIHKGITVEVALSDQTFIKQFNEFCTQNNSTYRKQLLWFILSRGDSLKLSIAELTEALIAANNKNRQGARNYLIGIMKKLKQRKDLGIVPAGMNKDVQVYTYLAERMNSGKTFLSFYDFDGSVLKYQLKDPEDAVCISDWFKAVVIDVERETGVRIEIKAA